MIAPILAPILATLAANGLDLVADAAKTKGKEAVEELLGVELKADMSANELQETRINMVAHKEKLLEMAYGDRANARAMQVEALRQGDKLSKRFVYYFASFWSVVAAAYVAFITFGNIPEENVRFADTILGFILGTVVATIIQFFFGSSIKNDGRD